jgi:hypothetical protein
LTIAQAMMSVQTVMNVFSVLMMITAQAHNKFVLETINVLIA